MAKRDPAVFAEFVAGRSPALHRAAYLMLGDAHLAQDLVQEALTKTYVAWPCLRDPGAAEAYTRKVITTTAITWMRRRGFHGERPTDTLPETISNPAQHGVDERDVLSRALGLLPPRQRAAVVLRFYCDLTEAATADALGCSIGTVKSQVHHALATLRGALADHLELTHSTGDHHA